jgi:alpha-tubulin suppressor-like RCC1 family protein
VAGGAVWCFPLPGYTLTDSTYLGAGLGPTDTTTSPVQVLTTTGGGTPIANITQISGGLTSYANFCAVASDGSVWCWGYGSNGQLGNGGTANSSLATQVLANAGTPFGGVAEVRIGNYATCARKTDGTVWCWGLNSYEDLGVSPTTTPHSYYPIQVPFSGTSAQRTATHLATNNYDTYCAIMMDTSVVCWGYSYYGEAGALPTTSPYLVGPTSVLVTSGGSALTGIVDIAGGSDTSMCAKNTNLQVQCWGSFAGSSGSTPYPAAYQNSLGTAAVGIIQPLSTCSGGIDYIDPSGLLVSAGTTVNPVPPCTNLLP